MEQLPTELEFRAFVGLAIVAIFVVLDGLFPQMVQ
jgi:hypothetical protein